MPDFDWQFESDYPLGLPGDTWRAGGLNVVKLSDMTESYIENCMNPVGCDDLWYQAFQRELERRRTT